jgi:predicted PurR-regulated permease PerM
VCLEAGAFGLAPKAQKKTVACPLFALDPYCWSGCWPIIQPSNPTLTAMLPFRNDRILTVAALLLVASGCLLVLWPFLTAALWAVIVASTSWPLFRRLDQALGGRRALAASLMTALGVLLLLGPLTMMALGLADNLAELGTAVMALLRDGLPAAPEWLGDIPLIGSRAHDYWQQFVHDGPQLSAELGKLAEPARVAALGAGRVLGRGVMDIGLAIFIAFFLFLYGEALGARLRTAAEHLAGRRAQHLLGLVQHTVAGVIYGVLGTALAQGALAAIGFFIAGVPGALLLGLATALLSVVPVGPPLIWGGAALWMFQQGNTGWALFVVVWGFFVVSMVDNVLKPFIISRGANMPFVVVLLGVLGGVLAFGVIGAFIGPTLLAVGYRLLAEWTAADAGSEDDEAPTGGASSR